MISPGSLIRFKKRSKPRSFEFTNNQTTTKTDNKNLNKLINGLIIEIFKYMAESERLRIKERQRQGIEIAN